MISPQDWGLVPTPPPSPGGTVTGVTRGTEGSSGAAFQALAEEVESRLGTSLEAVVNRCRKTVEEWLPRHFDSESGAFFGHYDPVKAAFEAPQLVNLIAPWLALAAYDRWDDAKLLDMAARAADWLSASGLVVHHPMSLAQGGVLESGTNEAWIKYAAEYAVLCLGLFRRTGRVEYRHRAEACGRFLIQSARHGCAPTYAIRGTGRETWVPRGWHAFGRAVEATLSLHEETGEEVWLRTATAFADHSCTMQAADGGFYLMYEEYYNTDLAADPLRGLAHLAAATADRRYLESARRFADWHVERQQADGSWQMTVDLDGNVVCPVVGPGDVPNIAIGLIALHRACGDDRYLQAAARACAYSLSVQITPESGYPYRDDPAVCWGFWSWVPFYDYTVSADQATHHVRGLWFLIDYLWSRAVRPAV